MRSKAKKEKALHFRATAEEYGEIMKRAAARGVKASEYMRRSALAGEPPENTAELTRQLSRMNYEINKIGTNVNQIARLCNENGYTTSRELEDVKAELKKVNEQTSAILRGAAKF